MLAWNATENGKNFDKDDTDVISITLRKLAKLSKEREMDVLPMKKIG